VVSLILCFLLPLFCKKKRHSASTLSYEASYQTQTQTDITGRGHSASTLSYEASYQTQTQTDITGRERRESRNYSTVTGTTV
jgi:hypothetical protein